MPRAAVAARACAGAGFAKRDGTLPSVDTSGIGIEAAKLMEELAERLPEDAELANLTLVAVVTVPDGDSADQHVYWHSTHGSRLEQIGALQTAVEMAITTDAEPQ